MGWIFVSQKLSDVSESVAAEWTQAPAGDMEREIEKMLQAAEV